MQPIEFARLLQSMGAPVFRTRGFNSTGGANTPNLAHKQAVTAGRDDLADYKPGDHLGMLTGIKFDVIDLDCKGGAQGFQTADLLLDVYPRTYARVRTPSQGVHDYVVSVNSTTIRHGGIDLQSNGMFVWLPGTTKTRGAASYVLESQQLQRVDWSDDSAAIFYSAFAGMRAASTGTAAGGGDWGRPGEPITTGRHATLVAYTMHLAKKGFDQARIVRMVEERSLDCAPPWPYGPIAHEVVTKWLPTALAKLTASGWTPPSLYEKTDIGNAERLRDHEQGNIRYARGVGWLQWNGSYWAYLDEEEVTGMAISNSKRIMEEARQSPEPDPKIKGRGIAWAERSQMMEHVTKCVAALRGLEGVRLNPDLLDGRLDILGVANGTVELRTGRLRPASKDDFITKALTVDYRPDAKYGEWARFLESCHAGQEEMVDYLQLLTGYGVTGAVSEQCFIMLVGKGANGKSVFTDALTRVFKQISRTAAIQTFLQHKASGGSGHSSDLAALRGARLVFTSESNQGDRLDEAKMKLLTGSEQVTAREAYGKQFEFQPQFLLFMSSNALPNIYDASDGTWRRLKLVNWPHSFAKNPDKGLPDRLRLEDEGILAWAVDGARMWYAHGNIPVPGVVSDAVDRYREDQDVLDGFLPGVLAQDPDGFIANVAVYKLYREWCDDEGTKAWQRKTLFAQLRAKDVDTTVRQGKPGWRLTQVQ